MNHRVDVAGETFLIGTGIGSRIRDVLAEIARQAESLTHTCVRLVPAPSPFEMYEIERRNAIVDSNRFTERTFWEPQVRLKDGLQLTLSESISSI